MKFDFYFPATGKFNPSIIKIYSALPPEDSNLTSDKTCARDKFNLRRVNLKLN